MKNKIQKWLCYPNMEIMAGVLFAALSVYMKKFDCAIIWVAFTIPWFIVKWIHQANDKLKAEVKSYEEKIAKIEYIMLLASHNNDELELLLRLEHYKRLFAENNMALCHKKIDLKLYLERYNEYETMIDLTKTILREVVKKGEKKDGK